jgi:predicted transglutaminase-like cysteine proteinase
MIDAVDRIHSHSIYPTLVYAQRVYGNRPVLSASIIDTVANGTQVDGGNIFAAIQGKGEVSTNPFKVLLRNSPYVQYKEEDVSQPNILAGLFLQYPNAKLKKLAFTIVNPTDSNDVKMRKITSWVVRNIQYKTDDENYGHEELWAAPTMTLAKRSGDCEDGAFLIHSLALNAGVPASRLRTYGGLVKAGVGAATGGHGWTAYRRESDNEWVVFDFSYYPNALPASQRPLMSKDKRYIDDYFYMTLSEYVTTEYSNRVREPDAYDNMGQIKNNLWIGSLIDTLI